MNPTATKTRLVFLPLLLLSIAFIISYSFFYWLFYIHFAIIPLKQEIMEFWIPGGLAVIGILLWIRPRVHILKLDKDNGRIRGLYYIVAGFTIWTANLFAIRYLESATGKLTALHSIQEITQKPTTKYYTVDSFVILKEHSGNYGVMSYSGKRGQYLNMDIYIAVPISVDSTDTLSSPVAFLSVNYHKQISSSIKGSEREIEWEVFSTVSAAKFSAEDLPFKYLERTGNTKDRDNLEKAAKRSGMYHYGAPIIILEPVDESFEYRNGNKLGYMFWALGIGWTLWFIMIILPGHHEDKAKNFKSKNKSYAQKQLKELYDAIKPRKGFAATPVLIGINCLVFIIMVFAGLGFLAFGSWDLVAWGAIYEPYIKKGEWWRLVTSMFLHGGLMHLVMNMVGLALSGVFLEAVVKTKKFITGYLLSGIVAGIVSMGFHDKPVVAVGASGAIFGLYGMILAMIAFKVFDKSMNRFMLILLACTAGYSLLMGFLTEGIDNSAHIGGLVTGFLFGGLASPNRSEKKPPQTPPKEGL